MNRGEAASGGRVVEPRRLPRESKSEARTTSSNRELRSLQPGHDFRRLRETWAALYASRAHFETLFDLAPLALYTLDLRGCIIEVNLAGAAMVGRDRGGLIGKPLLGLIDVQPAAFWRHLRRCNDTGQRVASTLGFTTANGDRRVVQMTSVPVLDRSERPVAFRTAIADVTDQVRATVRTRDDLLAVVSHDLRNSLSAIRFATTLMTRAAPLGEGRPGPELVDLIRGSVQQMNATIQDLLQVSTIEAGTFAVMPQPEEVLPVVDEAVKVLASLLVGKSIQVQRALPENIPPILADRAQVLRVLSHLLGNAAKFAPDEGGRIQISARAQTREVCFTIADNGPGIRKDLVPHLFERYWQRRPGGRRQGVGLGLYIAQGIVSAHGGRIWVESHIGKGSAFHFTLPISGPGRDGERGARAAPSR